MKKLLVLMPIVLVSGCASMNGSFDCPATGGVRCKSMAEVDQMVSRGEFAAGRMVQHKSSQRGNGLVKVVKQDLLAGVAPKRSGDNVMRIWIAPYVDSGDIYHSSSFVYTVINESAWIGNPAMLPDYK